MASARVPEEDRGPGRPLTASSCASGARPLPLLRAALTSVGAAAAAAASPWGTGWTPSAWAATGTTSPLVVTPLWAWCFEWTPSKCWSHGGGGTGRGQGARCRATEEAGSSRGRPCPCLHGSQPPGATRSAPLFLHRDVRALGITLMGHQKKILGSIQTMRAQLTSTQGPHRHL